MASQAPKVDIVSKLMFVLSAVAILGAVVVLASSLLNTIKKNSTKGELDNTQLVVSTGENLKPIGTSVEAGAVVASATGRSGKVVYDAVCTACHGTGVLESPKLGDKAAWEARAAKGIDGLLKTAISGIGSMPAKGGDPSLTDEELKATILYIAKESGIDLGGATKAMEAAPATAEAKKEVTEEATKVVTEEAPKAEAPKAEAEPVKVAAETATAVATTEAPAASADNSAEGKAVYDAACFACHATGVANSPILGNKEVWAPRIATGKEALYATALNGKGAMPPKGGNMALEDAKVKAAVDYMISQSQ